MRLWRMLGVMAIAGAVGCGGSSSDGVTDPGTTGNQGAAKTMTATFNGVSFVPTLMTSAYLNGQVVVSANDGSRTLQISGLNVGATGTYSFAGGNANTLLMTWIDANGQYSSGFPTGGGTITFTTLQLGRVAGSFNVPVRNVAANPATVTLVGTFDIKFP